MPINAKLGGVGGEVKTAEIKLRLPWTIGRGRGCTIMLPQALVSRQHCELFENSGKLMVRDLGSLNGTFVNNQKIAEPSAINSEELLTIGTVTFRAVYETGVNAEPPEGPPPVMKTAAKDTLPAQIVPDDSLQDDTSQPLEISDFDFEDTVRPGGDEGAPAAPLQAAKTPAKPLEMPSIQVGASKPAAAPAAPAVSATAAKPAPIPVPAPAAVAPAPLPIPSKPAAAAFPAPTPAAAPAPAAKQNEEEKEEEEDDFQDFLKSLGSK